MLAPRFNVGWVSSNRNRIESRRDDAGPLPEYVTLVVLDSAMAQENDKLLFEIALSVMLLLVLDVLLHDRNLRHAYAEGPVPFLLGKPAPHPQGRAALEFLDDLGEGVSRREDKKQMNVICGSASGDKRKSLAAGNATQVGVEFGGTCSGNDGEAIFCAEDAMHEIARVRMRHGAPSLGDSDSTTSTPRTPR